MLDLFLRNKICLAYSPDCMIPRIPKVDDVLYALRLLPDNDCYAFCMMNYAQYISNVHLVAAAVGANTIGIRPGAIPAETRMIIALAIIDLCPPRAKCLFDNTYVATLLEAGHDTTMAEGSHDEVLAACTCLACSRNRD
jgi:hypothetical protein